VLEAPFELTELTAFSRANRASKLKNAQALVFVFDGTDRQAKREQKRQKTLLTLLTSPKIKATLNGE